MAWIVNLLGILLTCTFLAYLTTGQKIALCTKPIVKSTGLVPTCYISDLPNPPPTVDGSKNCCKWNKTTGARTIKCCAIFEGFQTPNCTTGYSTMACDCKPLPAKKPNTCNKAFFYGDPVPDSGTAVVRKCCKNKEIATKVCCQSLNCPENYSTNCNATGTGFG